MKPAFYIPILILFFCAAGLRAQTDTLLPKANGGAVLGIRGGLTQSNYYGPDVGSYFSGTTTRAIYGAHAGLTVNNKLTEHLWLKHELLYTQMGAGVSINDSINPVYKTSLKSHALVLFPFSFTYHHKGMQVFAGPHLSTLLAATIQRKDKNGNFFNDKGIYGSATQFEDTSKYLQKLDYGFTAGLEYQFKCGFSIRAAYVRGFVELLDYANKNILRDRRNKYRIYNQYFNISLAYYFDRRRNGK